MNSYRCGKCGQKIYERAEVCPFCSARLVYFRPNHSGAVATAAVSFLLIVYLAFVFGLFYDRLAANGGIHGILERIQSRIDIQKGDGAP